jgi:ABC-type amino acid transport substrate-binding protein
MEVARGEEFDAIRRYWRSPEGEAQLVKSYDDGLKKVRDPDSNYVFLGESLSAKYHANRRPCDLVTVGEPIGSRSYGFAVPTGMPFAWSDELHRALLEMMEEGDLEVFVFKFISF